MKLLHRTRTGALYDRLVWQSASLLLAYPDESRLDAVENLLAHVEGAAAEHLSRTVAALHRLDPLRAAQNYVDTFDMRRRCSSISRRWNLTLPWRGRVGSHERSEMRDGVG